MYLPVDRYLGLNDIVPFETLLNVSINVVSSRVGNKFIRVKPEDVQLTRLYLYHVETENEKHWHGIGNIQVFFNCTYFCHTCLKPYQNKDKHICETSCDMCYTIPVQRLKSKWNVELVVVSAVRLHVLKDIRSVKWFAKTGFLLLVSYGINVRNVE